MNRTLGWSLKNHMIFKLIKYEANETKITIICTIISTIYVLYIRGVLKKLYERFFR